MYRGLTREILSILSWIVAGAAGAYFVFFHRPVAKDIADQMGAPVIVAQIAITALLFVMVLIIVHLITSKISDTILDSNIGMIDRLLGLAYGVGRGFLLIVIPFMMYEAYFPEAQQRPEWVNKTISLPYIQNTGRTITVMLKQYVPEKFWNPQATEQQSSVKPLGNHRLVLVKPGKVHISVTLRSGSRLHSAA